MVKCTIIPLKTNIEPSLFLRSHVSHHPDRVQSLTYTAFTLHKLNRSNHSTTVLGASVNAFIPFCSVPFRSVPLKNGTVKFAVRESSERSFSFIAISIA